jgi:glycosidase
LRNLVDEAHARGMAVMIDWVTNQTSWDHPWITEHKDWYLQDGAGNIIQFNTYSDVAALDFSNTSMRAEMINAMRYWVFTANIDGFRCDFADNPPIDYWQEAITSLRGITSHKLLLLAEGSRSANYTAGFDLIFGFQFYYNSLLPIYESGSSALLINNSNTREYISASDTQLVARYLSNHDIYGSEGSPYTIFNGKDGTLAAFVVTAFMKSVPFIYNGMEVGNTVPMPFPFTSSVIDWTEDESITPEMINLIDIRNKNIAIRRGSLTSYTNADVCAFTKVMGTEAVFVLSNLRNAEKTFTLPSGIANTSMFDELANINVNLGTTISLAAYEYIIFTTDNFVSVNEGTLNPVTGPIVYPNPAKDGTVIITLPADHSDVVMHVFNVGGKLVLCKQLDSEPVDISNLEKGIYVIKLACSENVISTKFAIE